jgi:hypothetical protein
MRPLSDLMSNPDIDPDEIKPQEKRAGLKFSPNGNVPLYDVYSTPYIQYLPE